MVGDSALLSAAKLTFLNNCLGAHQTVFVMHLYDVLVFLKSACKVLAHLAGTCTPISESICKGLSYLGEKKNFLVNPDMSLLPDSYQAGTGSKTKLKGILTDQNGKTLDEFPAEGCIDEETVKIDWEALNNMGNFIHSYIYRVDDMSTASQVSNTFTQLIPEDKHTALTEIVKHLSKTHESEYVGTKMDVKVSDDYAVVVSITKKEKRAKKAGKKKVSNEPYNRPMGYLNIQPPSAGG
jgi:hypothetical protein